MTLERLWLSVAEAAHVTGRRVRCATPGCPVMIPDDGRRLCHFDRRSLELAGMV